MPNIKELLKGKLTQKQLKLLRRSYDVIGNIAILEIPDELKGKQKLIAEAVLKSNKSILTVVKKKGAHEGELRIQKTTHLAGFRTKETEHKELGARLKLNIDKTYFSPRMANERKRITEQVKDNERILAMFSGIAPYPIAIAKNKKAKEIIAVEKNKDAHKYAEQNIKLNKLKNIKAINGDVRTIVSKLKTKFDRILMPLPKGAEQFLDLAFMAAKKGTIVHFYDFLQEEEIPQAVIRKITDAANRLKRKVKILKIVRCGQLGVRMYRVCADFEVL